MYFFIYSHFSLFLFFIIIIVFFFSCFFFPRSFLFLSTLDS